MTPQTLIGPKFQGAYEITRWTERRGAGNAQEYQEIAPASRRWIQSCWDDYYTGSRREDGGEDRTVQFLAGDTYVYLADDERGREASEYIAEYEQKEARHFQILSREVRSFLKVGKGLKQVKPNAEFRREAKRTLASFDKSIQELKKKYAQMAVPSQARYFGAFLEAVHPLGESPAPPAQNSLL